MDCRAQDRQYRERGQALVFITLSLVTLFGMMGLAVDFGWAYWRREAARSAAEAATSAIVLAAGSTAPTAQSDTACPSQPSASTAWQVGCIFATQNGFTNGSHGQSVSVQIGTSATGMPVSGVSPTSYWVTVTISETIHTFFSQILGKSGITIKSQATSAVYKGTASGCIYVLDPSASKAFFTSGGTFSTSCGVFINSTSSTAFDITGGTVNLNSAKANVHATSVSPWPPSGGTVSPGISSVLFGQNAVSNPISGLTAPTASSPCILDPSITDSGTHTLNPGTYCTGITIKSGSIKLNAGLYYLTSGSFKVSGTNTNSPVDATSGVTLYFPPSSSGTLSVTGGAGLNLTAPSGGSYDGIAVWKEASNHSSPPTDSAAWTGSNVVINGVLYMPYTALTYTGGTTAENATIVAGTFTTTGGTISGPATSKYLTGTGSGSGSGAAYLVE